MYGTIRAYASRELADELVGRTDEIEALISGVPGLRGYYLIRTDDGCASVTVCDDQAGTEESTRIVADWFREHAREVPQVTPQVTGGEVLVQAGASARV